MKKLRVTRLVKDDAVNLQSLIDQETASLTRLASPFTLNDAYNFINLYNTYAIIVDEKLAGAIEIKSTGETAYVVGKQWRNQGVCTQAIRALNTKNSLKFMKINNLWCLIHPDNIASIRVAQKCGLEIKYVK